MGTEAMGIVAAEVVGVEDTTAEADTTEVVCNIQIQATMFIRNIKVEWTWWIIEEATAAQEAIEAGFMSIGEGVVGVWRGSRIVQQTISVLHPVIFHIKRAGVSAINAYFDVLTY